MMTFQRISYADLNARQRECYNYQKVSAVLADFGFATIRLSDDWQGADFIAQHLDGGTFLKIQLKSRFVIDKKYTGRGLHICFPEDMAWYLYPHDEVMELLLRETNIGTTASWLEKGGYSMPGLSRENLRLLEPYRLA